MRYVRDMRPLTLLNMDYKILARTFALGMKSVDIITARKRSLRRLCFYTCLSVILFTGGCLPQCMLGNTPTPGNRHKPPPHPGADTTQEEASPAQCMLGDAGNKRVVRILLECILVINGEY